MEITNKVKKVVSAELTEYSEHLDDNFDMYFKLTFLTEDGVMQVTQKSIPRLYYKDQTVNISDMYTVCTPCKVRLALIYEGINLVEVLAINTQDNLMELMDGKCYNYIEDISSYEQLLEVKNTLLEIEIASYMNK